MTTDTTTTTTPSIWCGFARTGPRGRWQMLVRAATSEGQAMNRLRDLTADRKFVDLCVLPAGRRPDDPPRR